MTLKRLQQNYKTACTRERKLYRAMYPERYGSSGMSICAAVRKHYHALQSVARARFALDDFYRSAQIIVQPEVQ